MPADTFPERKKLRIVYRKLAQLRLREDNPRTHSDEQIEELVASIEEFGFTNPILIDEDNGVVAGHGRHEAAELAGLDQVPCIVLKDLTPEQIRAYVIADNKLALNGGWDDELLYSELAALADVGYDTSLTGFSEAEIAQLQRLDQQQNEDDPPPPPETPITKPGDIWELGPHRLMCGDCCDKEAVSRLLGDVVPNLMVTDPPYGVSYDADWRNHAEIDGRGAIGGRATGKVTNDDRADWQEAWQLFPGGVAYVWHSPTKSTVVSTSLESAGFEIRAQIIWAKNRLVIGRGHYHVKHEPCFYAVRSKHSTGSGWVGDRKQNTLWEVAHQRSETGHSTQKPVEVMRRPIMNNSSVGQAVYEPFSGSGTTIIAAHSCDRVCYAMEIEPAYVDVAVRRWEEYTGEKARRIPRRRSGGRKKTSKAA